MLKILLIDDDPAVRDTLRAGLSSEAVEVDTASDGDRGLQRAREEEFDLLIVDVGLPGINGFDLVKQLRDAGDTRPVIFLTAKSEEEDVIRGLDLGADGYVPKPFSLGEFKARVDALLRMMERVRRRELRSGDVVLDEVSREVTRRGAPIRLTDLEFKILLNLLKAQGRTVAREELLAKVWGIDFDPGTVTLDVHLSHLRRKLQERGPSIIHSVRGVGWRIGDPS